MITTQIMTFFFESFFSKCDFGHIGNFFISCLMLKKLTISCITLKNGQTCFKNYLKVCFVIFKPNA